MADGALHLPPCPVRRDDLLRTVRVHDLQLREAAREVPPRRRLEVPRRDGAHVVPAVPHEEAQFVGTLPEVAVEAVGRVEDAAVKGGRRGVEHLLSDLLPVEGGLVEADARHVEDGRGDGLLHGEGLRERGRGVLGAQHHILPPGGGARPAERGDRAVRGGPALRARHERPAAREDDLREEGARVLWGVEADGVDRIGRGARLIREKAHDNRVRPLHEVGREVAEAQVAPVVDVPAPLVERPPVDVDLVLRDARMDHLDVLARLRPVEEERERERRDALLVGRRGDPLRGAEVLVRARHGGGADPLRPPVRRLHDAHRPFGGRTPRALHARRRPGLHLPEDALGGREGLARVGDAHVRVARDAPGVPQVADVPREVLSRGGGEDAPGGLHHVAPVRRELPPEARRGGVEATGVLAVLDGQPMRHTGGGGLIGGRAAADEASRQSPDDDATRQEVLHRSSPFQIQACPARRFIVASAVSRFFAKSFLSPQPHSQETPPA